MATTHINPSHHTARAQERNVSFARVLRSEWIKIRSLRSTIILLLSTIAVMVGLGSLGAWGITMAAEEGQPLTDQVIHTMPSGGLTFAQLLIGSLAVMLISSEFGTGMIRSTMTAVPGRVPAVTAKALLIAIIAYLVGTASAFITYFAIQPVLTAQDLGFELTGTVARSMLLAGVYLSLIALLGIGLGSLLRNSAGSIVALSALLLVIPTALSMIPGDFASDLARYLPSNAGQQLTAVEITEGALTQAQGGLVLAAWALIPFIAGLIAIKRRDL
jgi:ABC-2 type transport system permease protein